MILTHSRAPRLARSPSCPSDASYTSYAVMSRRSPFKVSEDDGDDDRAPRDDRALGVSNDDDADDDKSQLLASLGPDAPPAHAVSAYEPQRDVEIGPGVDADESDLVDDIFDTAEEARANSTSTNVFCRCNLASSIMLIASMSLLVYSMVNPSTRDAITRFALTSNTERHHFDNVKKDPKTGRPTVELMEGEDEAQEENSRNGDWWRIESLKGSESPSKDHNQWDVSGLMLYSDDQCTKEIKVQSFEMQSESSTHAWQKRAEKGWGYLAGKEGAFIHEPLIGGSRISVNVDNWEVPKCLKIGTCYDAPSRRRALLQSSDEADALAAAQDDASVCKDTHFPSTIALYHFDKEKEEWDRLLQFQGTGVSDGALDRDGAKHRVRTFSFKDGDITEAGKTYFAPQ